MWLLSQSLQVGRLKCPFLAGIGLTYHVYRETHSDRVEKGHEALGLRVQPWLKLLHPPYDTEGGDSTLLTVP